MQFIVSICGLPDNTVLARLPHVQESRGVADTLFPVFLYNLIAILPPASSTTSRPRQILFTSFISAFPIVLKSRTSRSISPHLVSPRSWTTYKAGAGPLHVVRTYISILTLLAQAHWTIAPSPICLSISWKVTVRSFT